MVTEGGASNLARLTKLEEKLLSFLGIDLPGEDEEIFDTFDVVRQISIIYKNPKFSSSGTRRSQVSKLFVGLRVWLTGILSSDQTRAQTLVLEPEPKLKYSF